MILSTWLESRRRDPSPYLKFVLFDLGELGPASRECRQHLAGAVASARYDPAFLAAIADELDWNRVSHLLSQAAPKDLKARSGEFGEVLAAQLLEQFQGYVVPVQKLRFKITRGQMLPATDVFAMNVTEEGLVSEICYAESKLRASQDNGAAIDGCVQLHEVLTQRTPDILYFVLARLYETASPLFQPLTRFLRDRADQSSSTTCHLFLCYDANAWNDKTLDNVEEADLRVENLSIHSILISGLSPLVDDVLALLGIEVSWEDD